MKNKYALKMWARHLKDIWGITAKVSDLMHKDKAPSKLKEAILTDMLEAVKIEKPQLFEELTKYINTFTKEELEAHKTHCQCPQAIKEAIAELMPN